jgi:hypothetical protein
MDNFNWLLENKQILAACVPIKIISILDPMTINNLSNSRAKMNQA